MAAQPAPAPQQVEVLGGAAADVPQPQQLSADELDAIAREARIAKFAPPKNKSAQE